MTRLRIDVTPPSATGYDVIVAAGALASLGQVVAQAAPAHRHVLITDRNVSGHWGAHALSVLAATGLAADQIVIEPGEANKTRETWASVTDQMLAAGLGRDTTVIALGGGVIGDLAGFVASTYMRGLPVVQVPTTLLAMTDASVGGKTGVDVRSGKNLVGVFHQPRAVLADPETLRTLPGPELRGGLAEALKHGAIADAGYFDWIVDAAPALTRADPAVMTSLVLGSVRIKATFVALDTTEAGPRSALNFGHTIGHAIERASDYAIHHGHAVALGMLAETELGERMRVTQPQTLARLRAATRALGLPAAWPAQIQPEQVLEATRSDKKTRRGAVRFALLSGIGSLARGSSGEWTLPADDGLVLEVLHSLKG